MSSAGGSGGGGGGSGGGSDSGSGSGSGWDAEEYEPQMEAYLKHQMDQYLRRVNQQAVPSVVNRRTVIERDHAVAHQRLYNDYFAEDPRFPANLFTRRFRMRRELFMRNVNALERMYQYFRFRHDAAGRPDHTPTQKCMTAIRQLAYGGATDMWNEYLHIGETTALECLKYFCQGVIAVFRD